MTVYPFLTFTVWKGYSISCARACAQVRQALIPETLNESSPEHCPGIREQAAGRVLSDTSILLHRREGRKAASGCQKKGCAGK
jgi:hypothetical protein